ncbi:hypothetical protein IC582_029037 [Cucumis melo]
MFIYSSAYLQPLFSYTDNVYLLQKNIFQKLVKFVLYYLFFFRVSRLIRKIYFMYHCQVSMCSFLRLRFVAILDLKRGTKNLVLVVETF